MAMSIPRPDPASPAQVADATFPTTRRGFDQAEVRAFLHTVSAELTRLTHREVVLERELEAARATPDLSAGQFDDETLTRMLGEETVRILNAARESSHEIREKAEQAAAQMLMEASDESIRLREEAEIEASRRRADAANDAEAEISMAKQQGREMVNEARAYRERVLSELARRRELAREQIEQLVHGRDRLMQAFERARLVAVDVVAEMQPLGEPDEYVNLQPSTGPVPVMVAREAMAPSSGRADEAAETATQTEAATADPETAAEQADVDQADVEQPATGDSTGAIYDHAIDDLDDDGADVDGTVVAGTDDADVGADDADDGEDGGTMAEIVGIHAHSVAAASGDTAELDDTSATESDPDSDAPATRTDTTDVDHDEDADGVEVDAAIEDDSDPGSDLAGVTAPERANRPDPDDGSVDDVVVDLFARIRATADDQRPDEADQADSDDVISAATDADAPDAAAAVIDADSDADSDDAARGQDENPDEEREVTPFEQRDADLTPLIVGSARKLKRVLADEQNEVLDALRRSDPVRNLDALLPWANHHAERYSSVIADDLLEAANAGATLTSGTSSGKLRAAAGKQAVQQASEAIARGLVAPLRDRLERCIAEGDGDNAAITKKIRSVYREFKTQHIDEQLDDVFRAAHGRGVLASFELDTPVQWTPDPSHDVCPDCDDNRLEGAVAAGQAFPTGHLCTPAHPGCRCILMPADR
ncbi:DivIVA domain-containing protein [Ilumatobacter sp.]|uniref:DivIVA domain-containing protein n=1 Tax=Ilumatobacter sp. TaxID=1967498 RepID=UPI003C40BC07